MSAVRAATDCRPSRGGSRGVLLAAALAVLAALPQLAAPPEAAAQENVVPEDAVALISRADRARILGSDDAPIRVVEISDFECPFCARYNRETFPTIDSLYIETGKIQYVWIGFPNPSHPRAFPAIEAAFCAGSVGKFWPMHDILFENQAEWMEAPNSMEVFARYASGLGIDVPSFALCMTHDRMAPLMVRDYEGVVRAGISQTPFFIVADSVPIVGAAPLEQFVEAIDAILEAKAGD